MTSEHDKELQELRKFMKDQEQKHKKVLDLFEQTEEFLQEHEEYRSMEDYQRGGEGVNLLVDMESEDK